MHDLKADLELCNRASGESWKQASDTGYPYTIMDETFENVMAVYCTGDDAQFIAQSREGWPHAIERAIKAETLARELAEAMGCLSYYVMTGEIDTPRFYKDFELCNKALAKSKEVLGDE